MIDGWSVLAALLVTAAVLPALARLAPRLRLVDEPTARSTHVVPVPRVGGIGVALGVGVVVAMGRAGLDAAGAWEPYLVPAALYLAIGLADDRAPLRASVKFTAQAAAAALAVWLGLRWGGAAAGPFAAIGFGALTPFMTWLWLVAAVVLVNLLDGLDLITVATTIVVLGAAAGGGAGPGGGTLYAIAAGAVLGLAFWNVTPARVFPGDAGTHLLGFLVASAALGVPGDGAASARALPWALASAPLVPGVVDVALGLVGKGRRGVPLVRAHSDHLSQRLAKAAGSHARSALRYGALCLVALLLVTVIARAAGLVACLALGAIVLAWHLGSALHATRAVPWSPSKAGDPP